MKLKIQTTFVSMVAAAGFLACGTAAADQTKTSTHESDLTKMATKAYIYAYPLVTMDVTRSVMTNVAKPEGNKAPMGQFAHVKEHPTAMSKDHKAPSSDVLYSYAWVDLSNEPYVLHVPATDRYHLMPLVSGWTEVFDVPGKRTMGSKARDYAIVGPNWKGTLPKGLVKLKSPTNMVWIPGHTYCINDPEEIKTVAALQEQYTLKPLSSFGKEYTAPEGKIDPAIDMNTPARDQVNAMDGATFFKRFAELLKTNPPTQQDKKMLAKLAKMGIVPGQDFDASKIDAQTLNEAVKLAQEKIAKHEKATTDKNGWQLTMKTGKYGKDYLQRAHMTAERLGANKPQDEICPMSGKDRQGNPLTGANTYKVHFAKGQIPQAKGAWSLTMYDKDMMFSDNALHRFNLSGKNDLKFNTDGSLDIYVQHQSPGADKESNWLPAPEGEFVLMQRYYWPGTTVIGNSQWALPTIEMTGASSMATSNQGAQNTKVNTNQTNSKTTTTVQ